MPVRDGVTATGRLHAAGGPPVLVLTTFDDDEVLWGAIEAGEAGFLLKDTPADDLVRGATVAAGGSWLDPRVTPRLLARCASHPRRRPDPRQRSTDRASARSRCCASSAQGRSNLEIAEWLHVSERTVKGHIGSIFAKLGARDRAAAIIIAYESGLIVPGAPRADGVQRRRYGEGRTRAASRRCGERRLGARMTGWGSTRADSYSRPSGFDAAPGSTRPDSSAPTWRRSLPTC